MTEDERKEIVSKAAKRIYANMEKLDGYSKLMILERLVNMLDDVHLRALDFSIDMTPSAEDEK
jgi:hypothetical protein